MICEMLSAAPLGRPAILEFNGLFAFGGAHAARVIKAKAEKV